jgi:hypothetical protein
MTRLTPQTLGLLQADLQEDRWFTILGTTPDATDILLQAPGYQAAVAAFAAQEAGPVQIALWQDGQQPYEVLFVTRAATEPVRWLLGAWGITPATIRKTHHGAMNRTAFTDIFALPVPD